MSNALTGYIVKGRLTNSKGKDLGYEISWEKHVYSPEPWGKTYAVVLEKQTTTDERNGKVQLAAGYSLGEQGLFRGEKLGTVRYDNRTAFTDAQDTAKRESEHWAQRDAEDQEEADREQEVEGDELSERASEVSADDVRELVLFIENDGDLYRSMTTPIMKNLAKKMLKGTYNHALAVKGWGHLANAGAQKYTKEYGSTGGSNGSYGSFDAATRRAVAAELAEGFEHEMEAQGQAGIEHLAKLK